MFTYVDQTLITQRSYDRHATFVFGGGESEVKAVKAWSVKNVESAHRLLLKHTCKHLFPSKLFFQLTVESYRRLKKIPECVQTTS